MSDRELWSVDEQGRRLAAGFARADAPRSRRGRYGLIAVATAAILLVAGTLVSRGGPSKPFTVEEAVAAVVRVAYDQPDPSSDRVVYSKKKLMNLWSPYNRPDLNYKVPAVDIVERWYRQGDKKGWMRWTVTRGEDLSVRTLTCRTVLARHEGPDSPSIALNLPEGVPLPEDPKQAYELIRRRASNVSVFGRDDGVWNSIGYLMTGGAPTLTSKQRAAVIGALAYVKGVTVIDNEVDPLGNRAIGFAHRVGRVHEAIYFDAKTSLVTYSDAIVTKPLRQGGVLLSTGTKLTSQALLDRREVDRYPKLTQTPRRQAGKLAMLCPEIRHQKRK